MKKCGLFLFFLLSSAMLLLGCAKEKKYELLAEYEGLVFENDTFSLIFLSLIRMSFLRLENSIIMAVKSGLPLHGMVMLFCVRMEKNQRFLWLE